jgi:hypothetical protein
MIKKKLLLSISAMLLLFGISFYSGCGSDDSTTGPPAASGWPPVFNFKTGQTFVYRNDSIANVLGVTTVIPTKKRSTDIVLAQQFFGGQNCYPFAGSTVDTGTGQSTPDLYYVYYTGGKYYQYGIRKLIDTTQPATWDLVGDFNVARKTTYAIGNINYTVNLPGFPNTNFTGPLTGQIADSTTFNTVSPFNETIHCYRIELNAKLSASVSGIPITGDVYIDYYLGYSSTDFPTNPSGMVALKLRPFAFNVAGTPQLYEPGYLRELRSHNP